MICKSCQERRHDDCRGGTWCDCQHQPPAEPDRAEDEQAEPAVNWLRQG
jgi:hypothetical protein